MPGLYDQIAGFNPNASGWLNRILRQSDENAGGLAGSESAVSGISSTGDVAGKFGLDEKSIESKYRLGRGRLSSGLSRSRSALASRMGSGAAVPEAAFGAVEGNYADAFSGLEGAEAGEKAQNKQFIASILQSILGQQDAFKLNKSGLLSRILSGNAGVAQQYGEQQETDRRNEGSFWDDIGAGVDLAGKVLGLGGKIFGL